MLIVADDRVGLEADLAAGRLDVPAVRVGGSGRLGLRSSARSADAGGVCGGCGRGAAAAGMRGAGRRMCCLPDVCLLRRRDAVEVIGEAVLAATGMGYRPIAEQFGRPAETVRDWLARFRSRAEVIAAHFWRWAQGA